MSLPPLSKEMEDKLEQWVAAKRQRDFETSDRIRAEMKDAGVNPEEMKLRTQHAGLSQWRQMVRPTLVWAVDTPPAAPRPLCGQAPGTGTPHACPAGCGAWRSEAGECRAGTADPIWIMMWPLLESVVATIAHVQPTPRTQSGWYCGHC